MWSHIHPTDGSEELMGARTHLPLDPSALSTMKATIHGTLTPYSVVPGSSRLYRRTCVGSVQI